MIRQYESYLHLKLTTLIQFTDIDSREQKNYLGGVLKQNLAPVPNHFKVIFHWTISLFNRKYCHQDILESRTENLKQR